MFDKQKVIQIAINEVGYLEKSKLAYQKDPSVINDKTAGAGLDNITKYNEEMHKVYPSVMDTKAPWCDAFVDWCFYKAYGLDNAKMLLCGNFDDYTVNSCRYYEKANRLDTIPTIGAQVFFTKNGKSNGCYHTGIVYDVDNTFFYTIEGNTSSGNTVVANGGCVAKKKYSIVNYKGKVLFGHPKYGDDEKRTLKTIDEVAHDVMKGKYGDGKEREARLTAEGYNYAEVRKRVNEIYNSQKQTKQETDNSNAKIIWDYLMKKINNPYGVAGLMGNLQAESGLNPKNLQNSCEKKSGYTDQIYTLNVDSGAYTNFVNDKYGYGIAQWTSAGRKQGLLNSRKNRSIGDLSVQLEWLYTELSTSYKNVLNGLKNAKSVREASDIVLTKFERPKNQSESIKVQRADYGQYFFNKYNK